MSVLPKDAEKYLEVYKKMLGPIKVTVDGVEVHVSFNPSAS